MDSDEPVKEDILQFVRELFKTTTDIGSLTVKQIRHAYLKERNKIELTEIENGCFKPIIERLYLEFHSEQEGSREKRNGVMADENENNQIESPVPEADPDSEDNSIKSLTARKTKRKRLLSSSESETESDESRQGKKNESVKMPEDSFEDESPKVKKRNKLKKERKSTKKSQDTENKPPKKENKEDESKNLKFLRSCCRAAGLFVHYNKLFLNCSFDEEKEKALFDLLKENGLRGKPTLGACKRLRLRREEMKALEDLDTANIISSTGRSHRWNTAKEDKKISDTSLSEVKKTYSRLKGIVDSEGSDSE